MFPSKLIANQLGTLPKSSILHNGSRMLTRSQKLSTLQSALPVQHSEKDSQFFVKLNTERAVLEYQRVGKTIKLNHTEVPSVFKGKGVGKLLAIAALDYVAENDLKMKIYCDFVFKHYKENEQKYKKYYREDPFI